MSTQVLATKLYTLALRPDSVLRPRLVNRLNAGEHGKLTLISAPTGFGKTTLITAWLDSNEREAAWLSLDDDDNDVVRFLTYFVASLQTVEPDIGIDILSLLESPQPPPIDSLLTSLLNQLVMMPEDFVQFALTSYNHLWHLMPTSSPSDHASPFCQSRASTGFSSWLVPRCSPENPAARWVTGQAP